jgi:gamma-glutamyl-gamma-aminobutyrate hydrolase PuuD
VGGYRPLIAIVAYHLDPERVRRWSSGGYGVPLPYVAALRRAGARTAILPPGEAGDPRELLEAFDGLLLVGGGDVDPTRYGAEPDIAHDYGAEPDRDELELALLRAADDLGMPSLCICRGAQLMNVAYGGSLHQHLPDLPGMLEHGVPTEGTRGTHDVAVVPGSRLSATTKEPVLVCSSHHHQGIDRVGEGLAVSGRAPDGLVEAIERIVEDPQDEAQTWMLGVQWHPEDTAASDPSQQALFDALSLIARLQGTRARPGRRHGRSRAYALSDPDPTWPARFEEEAARIGAALPEDLVVRIDHVGSTAVPGLAAKPVVDIQVSLTSLSPRAPYVEAIARLGYRHLLDPWSDEHEYFSRDEGADRAFHLHVCLAGGGWETRHLAFRDWLRTHPGDMRAYGELKRRLATEHPRDIMAYTDAKTPFIRAIEAKARVPAREKG